MQKAAILEGRTHWKQLKLAFSSWQHIVRVQHHGRYILFQLARRIDAQCMSRALQAWRQHVHRVQHLQRLEHNMAAKRQQMQLTAYLKVITGMMMMLMIDCHIGIDCLLWNTASPTCDLPS